MVTYIDSEIGPTKAFSAVLYHLSRFVANADYFMCDEFRDILNLQFLQEEKHLEFLYRPRPIDPGILDDANFDLAFSSSDLETDSAASTDGTVGEDFAHDDVAFILHRKTFSTVDRDRKSRVIAQLCIFQEEDVDGNTQENQWFFVNIVLLGLQDARPVEDVEGKLRMSEAEGNEVTAIVLFRKAESRIFGELHSLIFLRL